jgi:hypothetical protein
VTFLGDEGGTGPLGHRTFRRLEDPMESKKTISPGKALRKPGLVAALLLTALSLSACVVADRDDRGDGGRHHHWNDDRDWHGGAGWQGNGGDRDHHH